MVPLFYPSADWFHENSANQNEGEQEAHSTLLLVIFRFGYTRKMVFCGISLFSKQFLIIL